jgi:DNA-binding CsgD family transcriptional regulator
MPELILSEREQKSLRSLLARAPVPGAPIPPRDVLELVAELVPCDAMGAMLCANTGPVLAEVQVPRGYYDRMGSVHDSANAGPLILGRTHWSRSPQQAEACGALPAGLVDGISVGYRNGPDAVAQIWFDREDTMFTERDLAVLDLLWPVLQRHLRQQPTPTLPASLTVQERRVLMEVAAGFSNAEVAEGLCIAPSTVRKHLEHAYRKLGVTNRLAAVISLHGGPLPNPDLAERIDRTG